MNRRATIPRWLLLALGTIGLCSCQSVNDLGSPATFSLEEPGHRIVECPAEITSVRVGNSPPPCDFCQPLPGHVWGQPRDEYVCDGGDVGVRVRVRNDWSVDGLELEDTVAHYDTLAGEVVVVPSNRVCVYAPRFAATRQIQRPFQNQMNDLAIDARDLQSPHDQAGTMEAGAVKQPLATVRAVGTSIGRTLEEHQRGLLVEDVDQVIEWQNKLLPFENLQIVKWGTLSEDDTPLLVEGVAAAQTWSAVEMAQVVIDNRDAVEQKGRRQLQEEFVYETPDGTRLRLVKLASRKSAQPGDIVHFTLRFDNVGNEPIGNVTIIDHLTLRLEYVDKTQQCTLDADFSADDRSGGSLTLRWEIDEPLDPGEGGAIRFQCRVR